MVSVKLKKYLLFPGDLSKFSLKCGQCGKCVSPPEFIGAILFNVPQAILHHLKMKAADDDVLVLLEEFNEMIYGSKTKSDVSNRFCEFFQMNDDRIHDHLIQRYKNNDSNQGFSYEVVFDMMKHVVQAGNSCQLQLKLSHILSLSAITDSVGQGWNAVKISRHFKDITNDEDKQKVEEKQKMKTSRQF